MNINNTNIIYDISSRLSNIERWLLLFYIRGCFDQLINLLNNEIIKEGITYDTSATNYIYECKNSLNVLKSLTNGIKKKNFINFISF